MQMWPPADAGIGSAELRTAPPVNSPSLALLEELLNKEPQLSLWASPGINAGDRETECSISASRQINQPQSASTRGLLRMPECLPPWIWVQSQMLINTQTGAQHVIPHVSKAAGKPPFPLLVSEGGQEDSLILSLYAFPSPVPGSNHPCKKFHSPLTSPLSQMHCLQMFPKNAM